jgi:hypothetical protein
MRRPLIRPLTDESRTTLLWVLWAVSIGWVVIVFGMSISAAGFFGRSIGDGLRMAFEYQPWQAILSLSFLAIVALIHWWWHKGANRRR